jgi:hypothetical protein
MHEMGKSGALTKKDGELVEEFQIPREELAGKGALLCKEVARDRGPSAR